jgi:aminopeptidase
VSLLQEGARQAILNCLRVEPGESVVVITDQKTMEVGEALRDAVHQDASAQADLLVMEEYGDRPLAFPEAIARAMKRADCSIYAARGVPGELSSFRKPMLQVVDASPGLRHAHMVGITRAIMEDGMRTDYSEIQRVSQAVYEQVKDAQSIRVTSPAGTDFHARFNPEWRWKISDGLITPESWCNLPDGEVFTAPYTVEGVVVVDGCFGDFLSEKYGLIEATPVRIEVSRGRAVPGSVSSANEELRNDLCKILFETDENSDRVGEFAIGTNVGLTVLIGNLLQDEKFPGVHVAFGDPYPEKTNADWHSRSHVDGVIQRTTITVDGSVLMEAGKFFGF